MLAAWRVAPEFLPPADLVADVAGLASSDGATRAKAEIRVADAAQTLASLEHGRLVAPVSVDHNWASRAHYDARADFTAARARGQVAAWVTALPRIQLAYIALRAERARYLNILKRGGWLNVPSGPDLKLTSSGPRVLALRARLKAEDYLPVTVPDVPLYDAPLAAAVSVYQQHSSIEPNGVLDTSTLRALNVPVQARMAAIDASLERARWLADQLAPDRVEVDLTRAIATLFRDGRPVLSMRAIVGNVRHKTPIFRADITAIIFNPAWHVPHSIAAAELYPKERHSPGYFARNGIYVFEGRLIQRAGPKASLGLVKFEMNDPFAIYLHDTPARSLFKLYNRTLSHGCMRLEDPRALAAALLAAQGWDRPRIDALIATSATQGVALRTPTPVYVLYRTAEVVADGRTAFRRDVYGWDAKLLRALSAL